MKTSTVACVLMLVAAVALVASPVFAAPISMKDSADFNVKAFEGDTVNPTSVWTYVSDQTPTVSSDGDIVTWTTDGSDKCYWDASSSTEWLAVNKYVGYTLEFKVKINSQAGTEAAFVASANSNSGRPELFLEPSETLQRQNDGGSETKTSWHTIDTSDNTDDFHIFRIARDADVGAVHGKITYYRDGVAIATDVIGLEQLTSEVRFIFGDASAGYNGSVSVDYVRFDTTGAYAPVPEPSTIALLVSGLIGLLAYAWRKRK